MIAGLSGVQIGFGIESTDSSAWPQLEIADVLHCYRSLLKFYTKKMNLYLNTSDHLQQILPYKNSYVRQQCWCSLHLRHS